MSVNRRRCLTSRLLVGALLLSSTSLTLSQSVYAPAHKSILTARDKQDLPALKNGGDAAEHQAVLQPVPTTLFTAALSRSLEAEVALELGRKADAATAAESGIRLARRLVEQSPNVSEHHRLLGTLCGQIIPANLVSAFQYARCAREEVESAIRLDPKSPWAHLSRGVGSYYLPEAFGGGVSKAIEDFRHATALRPDFPDAWLWLGIALRKKGDISGARAALMKAKELAPARVWIQTQLEKTPAPKAASR